MEQQTEKQIRRYESNLVEAMALGVAGAAAVVGSSRLRRSRRGRFELDAHGMRLVLPAEVTEAIAIHTSERGSTLVMATPRGERSVKVVPESAALQATTDLRRRAVGDAVLYQLGERSGVLAGFEPIR